jgi:hypothetical protein
MPATWRDAVTAGITTIVVRTNQATQAKSWAHERLRIWSALHVRPAGLRSSTALLMELHDAAQANSGLEPASMAAAIGLALGAIVGSNYR